MKKELQGLYDLCISNGIAESDLKPYFATIESNLKTKRYGLVWEEQLEDIAADLKNKFPILVERDDLSIKADPNGLTNCLIEGDNYESLTFLKNSGVKVDCIYIDPPYNTGNKDFVYNDRYIDSEDTWRHSSWLSFMNKRLKLAKELLTEDGVIFISIDDNEVFNLKLLCDSIFGERNFIDTIILKSNSKGRFTNFLLHSHEYILVYRRTDKLSTFKGLPINPDDVIKQFNKEDTLGKFEPLEWRKRGAASRKEDSPNCFYPIFFSETKGLSLTSFENCIEIFPVLSDGTLGRWRGTKETFSSRIDTMYASKKRSGSYNIYEKKYYNETETLKTMKTILDKSSYTTEFGSLQVKSILGMDKFNYPKSTVLLKDLIRIHPNKNATVLDFFAGSGSTGHAVLELNKEDAGVRRFILCTNNEVSNIKELEFLKTIGKIMGDSKKELTESYKEYITKDEYAFFKESDEYANLGICRSVTYERLKRVINGYTNTKGKEIEGISSNLNYYNVNNIEAAVTQMEIDDILIENIVPFIQFKHNVWEKETVAEDLIELTSESESVYVYSNTLYLCDGFYEAINNTVKPTTLYIYDGLFEFLDEERLVNVNILSITNEFYKN